MTDRAIEQYLDIKVSISVSISIKIYLSNLNIQYLFRPYFRATFVRLQFIRRRLNPSVTQFCPRGATD